MSSCLLEKLRWSEASSEWWEPFKEAGLRVEAVSRCAFTIRSKACIQFEHCEHILKTRYTFIYLRQGPARSWKLTFEKSSPRKKIQNFLIAHGISNVASIKFLLHVNQRYLQHGRSSSIYVVNHFSYKKNYLPQTLYILLSLSVIVNHLTPMEFFKVQNRDHANQFNFPGFIQSTIKNQLIVLQQTQGLLCFS